MKYQRSMTLGGKDIEITKSEFVAKNQMSTTLGGEEIGGEVYCTSERKKKRREEKRKGKRKKMK